MTIIGHFKSNDWFKCDCHKSSTYYTYRFLFSFFFLFILFINKGQIGITLDTSYPLPKTDSSEDKIASELALQFYVSISFFIFWFYRFITLNRINWLILIIAWLVCPSNFLKEW